MTTTCEDNTAITLLQNKKGWGANFFSRVLHNINAQNRNQ